MAGSSGAHNHCGFSFPLALTAGGELDTTAEYHVWVQNTGDNSFYFLVNGIGSIYYGELESATAHTDKATAQPLSVPGTNEATYFVDGNLSPYSEADWYSVAVPSTVTGSSGSVAPDAVDLFCESGREGSGLLGFTATLVDTNGTDTSVKLTETNPAKVDLEIGADGNTALPANVTPGQPAYLKISVTGQQADNPSSYYRCGVIFSSNN